MAYDYIIEALEATWVSLEHVCADLSDAQWNAATPCPGWSVKDVISHLIGFELMLRGEGTPAAPATFGPHVKNDIGKINEAFVDARRGVDGDDVLAEFVRVAEGSLERLRDLDDEAWEVVGWSPEGDVPYARFMETRILDSWIHLQDVRDALLRPGDDAGYAEEIVVNRFEGYLPYVWGKRAQAPEGARLRVSLEGPLARSVDVVVTNGRAGVATTPGEPDLEIVTPASIFWRRGAGRVGAEAFLVAHDTVVQGDRELAARFARALAVMI